MNVAYLDPAYSGHFHALAGCLARRGGGRAVALLSSPAYRLYTGGDTALVWPPGRAEPSRRLPEALAAMPWAPRRGTPAMAHLAHAADWIAAQLAAQRVELLLAFSDARPFSLAAAAAARERGVDLVWFERGAFRFATSSLSVQGLNARFSLRVAQAQPGLVGMGAEASLARRPTEPWLRTRFAAFVLRNGLACLREPARATLQHKRYAFAHYLRLAAAQWWGARRTDDAALSALSPAQPVLVVPLQLPGDTQLAESPFDSNQDFVDFVVRTVRAATPEAAVLVKRHPMDTTRYRLPEGARWVGGNLARLDRLQPVVVCINSTVGFESLVRGLRVVCFGRSFYSDAPALVLATPQDFAARWRELLARPADPQAGAALRAAVLRGYQAPGDAWAYTPQDIEATADIVLQHVAAAHAAAATPAAAERAIA